MRRLLLLLLEMLRSWWRCPKCSLGQTLALQSSALQLWVLEPFVGREVWFEVSAYALVCHRGARCRVEVAAWGLGSGLQREMLGKRAAIFHVPWQKFNAPLGCCCIK
jgi:hypothetical protein